MKNSKNICRFVTDLNLDKLDVYAFIYETNLEVMKVPTKMRHKRAILLKNGSGTLIIDGTEINTCAGSLVFLFEGETAYISPSSHCEYMYIDFGGTRAQNLLNTFFINTHHRCFADFDGIIPLWYDSILRANETNLTLVAESMLLYAFSRLTANINEKNSLINEIIRISEERFYDTELSLATVAEELSYNPKYISHLFKEKMNVNYSEYLTTMRIKYAVTLLEHGIDSVKNVAFLAGFKDPMYFSTVFKKHVGISPRDYKKRLDKSGRDI